MASKSDKEGKGSKKSAPQSPKENPSKSSPKPKKQEEEDDDEDVDDDEETAKPSAKKGAAAKSSSKTKKEEDDDEEDDADYDEVDEWEKVEEEEEWDPDFDEFDIPKSKSKKASGTGGSTPAKKTAKGDDDDLGFDDDFKDLDLFGESGFDEEEDDF